ncbi:MAG: hypothetical protein Kow0092_39620 [Deferrisomatales bacterium]
MAKKRALKQLKPLSVAEGDVTTGRPPPAPPPEPATEEVEARAAEPPKPSAKRRSKAKSEAGAAGGAARKAAPEPEAPSAAQAVAEPAAKPAPEPEGSAPLVLSLARPSPEKVRVGVVLPKGLADALTDLSYAERKTVSFLVEEAVALYLEAKGWGDLVEELRGTGEE